MCQSVLALVLGDNFEIIVEFGGRKVTSLRVKETFFRHLIDFTICHLILLSLLIHICEVTFIHNFRYLILLIINVFNFQSGVRHDYQIFDHPSKVVLTHHQVF